MELFINDPKVKGNSMKDKMVNYFSVHVIFSRDQSSYLAV